MATNLYTLQASNIRRTWVLFIVFFVVFLGLGYFISLYYGDPSILVFAPGANGNVPPLRTITGSNTGLNYPVAIAVGP